MNKSILFLVIITVSFSCKAPLTVIHKSEIKNLSPFILYDSLKSNYGKIDTYIGKFKAVITQDKKTNTLYGTTKIRRDSILWFSINPGMGIEVARVQMLHDSVYFIDRFNSKYFKGRYEYIDKLFDIEIDYASLQSIFFNTLSFYTTVNDTQSVLKNVIIKKEKSGKFIQLENLRKRLVKKNESDVLSTPIYERVKVDNRNFKISEVVIKDFKDDRQMKVEYSNFVYVDALKVEFPQTISIKIDKGTKSIDLELTFSKQEFNQTSSYPFSIPESYKPYELKQ